MGVRAPPAEEFLAHRGDSNEFRAYGVGSNRAMTERFAYGRKIRSNRVCGRITHSHRRNSEGGFRVDYGRLLSISWNSGWGGKYRGGNLVPPPTVVVGLKSSHPALPLALNLANKRAKRPRPFRLVYILPLHLC